MIDLPVKAVEEEARITQLHEQEVRYLVQAPQAIIDYVVTHELAHLHERSQAIDFSLCLCVSVVNRSFWDDRKSKALC